MWILPSRSRPHNCARLFRHIRKPGILCIDNDDPQRELYEALPLPFSWILKTAPRVGLGEIYNRQFRAFPNLKWYGVLADDVVPETEDWEQQLIDAALPDGMAFGDDGINGHERGTHFVLAGELVRDIGWLALPGLDRIFIDTVWNDIAKKRGVRRYLPGVMVIHRHFSNQTAPWDETYRKTNKPADLAIYEQWRLS